MTLEEFILARLAEEERIALAAKGFGWTVRQLGRHDLAALLDGKELLAQLEGSRATASAVHMVRHSPERVLREIEAKTRIVSVYAQAHSDPERLHDTALHLQHYVLSDVVRLMALPYADHHEYRQEWAP